VTRAVVYISDEVGMRTVPGFWAQLIEQCANSSDYLNVLFFIVAADIISLSDFTLGDNLIKSSSMILHI